MSGKSANPETAEIQNFVQECLDDSLEKVIYRIGENGGYYFPSKISTPLLDVPYYLKNNQNLMPSKEEIQDQISRGIEKELFLCVENSALFPEYEITKGKMVIETKIEQERVLVDVNYPLTIIKGESKSKIEDFNSEVPVRLGIVYDAVAEFIIEDLKEEGMCVSCLLKVLEEDGLYVNNFKENENIEIFILTDYDSIINKKEFVYNFANEY
ncbi:MAG: hypothetical protein AABY06_01025 [Nanoarchaeota archaeon]